MTETPSLSLPLLHAAQAQKHITVNEALVRLDGLAQLILASISTIAPPPLPAEGACYAVPIGSSGAWAGQDGKIAIYSNGGWVFASPKVGWRAWVSDISGFAVFDGTNWIAGAVAVSTNGAAMIHDVIEMDHVVSAGATSTIVEAIPGHAIVFGVTGRVLQPLSGGLTGWKLGVAGSDSRYGAGLGVVAGNWIRGLTGTPVTYYAPEDLVLTSEGADFVGGSVRLAICVMRLNLPNA